MTEFALVLPVFMLIVAGILAFGRVFFYWIEANHLANETARWAAVDQSPDPAKYPQTDPEHLQRYALDSGGTLEFRDARVCINYLGAHPKPQPGDPIQVQIAKDFSFVPILGIAKITIRSEATMRIERLAGPDGTSPSYGYDGPPDPDDPPPSYPSAGAPYGACT